MEIIMKFFTSKHCAFCRAAKTILLDFAEQFADNLKVEEIDVDEDPKAAIDNAILALPVIIIGLSKFIGVPDKEDLSTAILNAFTGPGEDSAGGDKRLSQEVRH